MTERSESVGAMIEKVTGAREVVEQGGVLMRLENTTQMAIAVQRPRDEKAILASALATLDIYPSLAEEAIYARPVGKDDTGNDKVAEGLSIRAAEDLANRWGNNAFGAAIGKVTDDHTTIIAEYVDYQTNVRRSVEKFVSKSYKTRKGQIVQYAPDRYADTVVPKNISVALREVILRSLPPGLKKEYEAKARAILSKDKVGRMRDSLLKRFEEAGVPFTRVAAHAKKEIAKFNREDCIRYLGMVNAIRDGEAEVDEIFPPTEAERSANGASGRLPLTVKD